MIISGFATTPPIVPGFDMFKSNCHTLSKETIPANTLFKLTKLYYETSKIHLFLTGLVANNMCQCHVLIPYTIFWYMLCPLQQHATCHLKRKPFFMSGLKPTETFWCLKKTRFPNSACLDGNLSAINKIHIMTKLTEGCTIKFKLPINFSNNIYITNLGNIKVESEMTMTNNVLYFDIINEFPNIEINVSYNDLQYKLCTRDDFDNSHLYNNGSFIIIKETDLITIKCEIKNIFQALHMLIFDLNPDIILTYQSNDKITFLTEITPSLTHCRYDIKITSSFQSPFPLYFYIDLYSYLLHYNNNNKVINYDINQVYQIYCPDKNLKTKFEKCMSLLNNLDVVNFCYSLVSISKICVNDICVSICTRLNVLMSYIAFHTKSYVFSDSDFNLVLQNIQGNKCLYDMTKLYDTRVVCDCIYPNSVSVFNNITNELLKEGGTVLDPLLGLHQNLGIVIDFDKLYATTISELGICLSHVYVTNDVKCYIQFNPDAPLPVTLKNLITLRNKILTELSITTCSLKKKELNNKQLSIKLLSNSLFGYIYMKFPPLGVLIVKEAKKQFLHAKSICENMNCKVYYGDTDSLFLKFPKLNNLTDVMNFSDELVQYLNCQINPFSVKLEYYVVRSFFFSKKRYCLLTFDKHLHYSIIISGLFNRREWPFFFTTNYMCFCSKCYGKSYFSMCSL